MSACGYGFGFRFEEVAAVGREGVEECDEIGVDVEEFFVVDEQLEPGCEVRVVAKLHQ